MADPLSFLQRIMPGALGSSAPSNVDPTTLNSLQDVIPDKTSPSVKPDLAPASINAKLRDDGTSSSRYNVNKHSYPANLLEAGSTNQYGNTYVMFYINVIDEGAVTSTKNADMYGETVDDNISSATSGLSTSLKQTGGTVLGTAAQAGAATTVITGAIGLATAAVTGNLNPTAAIKITGGAAAAGVGTAVSTALVLSQGANVGRKTKRLKTAIALHMPNDLSVSYNVNWAATDTAMQQMMMGQFGTPSEKPTMAATDEKNALGSVANAALNAIKSAGKNALTAATVIALDKAPNKDVLSAMSGLTTNTKSEILFKNVDFRTFTFSYKFAPRNLLEFENTQRIIKLFKYHMHPEYKDGSGNFIYVYPSEFDIMYYVNGQRNKYLHRHTSCVLTNIVVNSSPNANFTAFGERTGADGAPTEINITLSFKELATLTKKQIEEGY